MSLAASQDFFISRLPERPIFVKLRASKPNRLSSRQQNSASRLEAKHQQRMRILLQQKETGLYFKDMGSWAPQSSEAMDFVSSTAAIDFCVSNKLSSVQLVLKFDEQQYDIVLPVRPLQDFGAECASAEG